MGARSPSPSGSLTQPKRRKYDDDERPRTSAEPSSSSRSTHRDRDRDREDRSRDSERDRRREKERTRDHRSERDSRGERERERDGRDRDGSSYKSRDGRERDRDEPRRGERREDDRDGRYPRGGGGSGTRREASAERDRRERGSKDDRVSDRDRPRRVDESSASKRRSYSRSPSPAKPTQRADHRRHPYPVEGSPPPSLPAPPEPKLKPSFVSTFNSTPLAASPSPAPSSPTSTSTPNPVASASSKASEDEEKLRIKREKLEAWKAKKAKEAAAATPAASSSAIPAKPVVAKGPTSNLPPKPIMASKSSLPAKPIGFHPALPLPTSATKALDPAAQALAAAAAISSRLAARASSSSTTSTPLLPSASLPPKPTFSFVSANLGSSTMSANPTPFRSTVTSNAGAKPSSKPAGLSLGGAEDDEVEARVGLVPFSSGAAGAAAAEEMEAQGDVEEEDDDEDLEGGVVFKAREGGRDGRIVEPEKSADEGEEDKDVEMTDATPVAESEKMVVDEEIAPAVVPEAVIEEEEEVDELDLFMSNVQAQVKNVDMQDMAKLSSNGKPVVGVKTTHLIDPEADGEIPEEEEEGSEDEIEKVGMGAADILALAAKKVVKRGRELHNVDHSKIAYEPFRKAFYHAPPEVELMTPEEVEEMRIEMDGIKVRGADPPKPVAKWSYCGLPAPCIEVIKGLGYTAPTSIQAQAIPAIMSGRDIIGVAKTGSGKTIAFLLPMFRHIKDQRPLKSMDGPIGMIMTPTRELATQIHKECKPFLKALGLRASCAYGGTPLKDNIAEMKRGSEIIVCTPGRMIELLTTNAGRIINLQRITYLVLDEADRMFDMGFEPQVMKIINQIRPDRQTVLFSATFPRQMEALARKILRRPLEITVGGRSIVAPEIEQIVEVREESTKFNRLLELLGQLSNDDADARALIFVERQESADKLLAELLRKNYSCMSLHGGMEQVDRDQTIADFKTGVVPVVIATSVAARGLDVKQLKLVVQYDAPNHMEDYVHRAGRTGRAGNKGTCVTFVTPEQDRYALDIFKALIASSAVVPDELRTLAEAFAEKIKAGKVSAASGFGGKGLDRLDHERDAQSRAERAAYGEAALPGEKKADEEVVVASGEAAATAPVIDVADLEVEIRRGPAPEPAKKSAAPVVLDSSISVADAKAAEAAALAAGKPAGVAKAASVIANFNAMLKAKAAARSGENNDTSTDSARRRDPDATDYHAIIYINDYPQKARWKVTNKDTMVQLIETTGAAITNKGVFYEPGKEPGPDELPKLHLLIESNDEFRVKHAISEIKRNLIEGATMALEAEQRGTGAPGRYQVN